MTTHLSGSAGKRQVDGEVAQGFRLYRDFGKRLLDLFLVLVSAPLHVPLMLVIAAFLATDGANPFFRQRRVGRGGRVFHILKLRTMVPDAEARLDAYLASDAEAAAEWKVAQKLRRDPRVTRLGRFLRKTSLDELPQVWNVLVGDMSLVGPRPMMPYQQELYPGTLYYTLRPGLTGAWQISSRNEAEFASRARYDSRYAANVSLWRDLNILARTVIVVVKGTGY